MSQAALWAVMRAYGIPDVDLLVSLYEHSTVRMEPNDPQCATITFDTGVAQGSALSPLLFLVFMNALLGLITVWGTPTGDMSATKTRIFKKTEEARDLLRHHPLTPEQAINLFTSIGVGAFRYSAALVPWTEKELERLETVWSWRRSCAATSSGVSNMKTWPDN